MLKQVILIIEENETEIFAADGRKAEQIAEEQREKLRKELSAHDVAFHMMSRAAYEKQSSRLSNMNTLYISDSEPVIRRLLAQNACVILFLNEHSRDMDFQGIPYAIESLDGIDYDYLEKVYLRHLGKPWTILTTERCIIREIMVEDVLELYRIYAEPEVARYTEALFENVEEELEYTKAYIEKVYAFYGYGMWIVEDRQTGAIIGRAGIESKEERSGVELGFLIAKPYWRQGLATEVIKAIMEYTKEELDIHTIYTVVQEENDKSAALCTKLGFAQVGNKMMDGKKYRVFEKDI